MSQHYINASDLYRKLSENWSDGFFHQNGNDLTAQWNAAAAQWFLPKTINQNKIVKLLVPFQSLVYRKPACKSLSGFSRSINGK
jgi:hypothetical protein